jgi:hypothetical protein
MYVYMLLFRQPNSTLSWVRKEGRSLTDVFKFPRGHIQPNILTQKGAIVPVSAMNKMVIRGLNILYI